MTPKEILETALGPTQSVMAVMNEQGDKKTIWDRNNETEVEAASREFTFFKGKGYMAYKVEGKEGRRGEILHEFDPSAERIIFAPQLRGGSHG